MINNNSRVHIIYCHPSTKSVTHDIKEGYINGLKDNNIEYTITDLYAINFKSDISEEEYFRENNDIPCPLSEDVYMEQNNINNADILTFIFPLFWMDTPSKLVGYFSRVFTKGFKYENDEGITRMKMMKETNFLISAGSNYDDLKKDGKINALETIFIHDRMAGKTLKSNMYFFTETTYHKEKIQKNKKRYVELARKIGRNTI